MTNPLPLVIDTDVGADPDDALALLLALGSPEVDLRGVTIVSGDVAWRARIAARLLGMAGRPDIPIVLGQGEPSQMLGSEGVGLLEHPYEGPEASVQTTPAVEWLLAESRQDPFHLVTIGPLSNVAAAIEADPGFAGRLLALTVMGGLLNPGTMPTAWQCAIRERGSAAWPDYNTMCDPEAALTVAHSGIPITWVTLDATMRAPLRAAGRQRLPADHPVGIALGRMIDAWHASWFPTALPAGDDSSPVPADAVAILHDPLALAALFPGDWLRLRPARLHAAIEDGIFRLHEQPDGVPARIAVDIDGPEFEAFLIERLIRAIRTQEDRRGVLRQSPPSRL